ncbi:DSD1 family PLP-dependent enzyme [Variovorax sp. NFACC27]|uniref:DSD1 family PLP-dependent enzyme n=1 Tax=unclassified Variovorax TaxID=663243 RepID=UPI00089D5274|nr:D-serine deaminase, pyridoxal phosphate-dependent [Variovorax sp. NFACC28]SEG68293.1 D-serine deaminase, pyridoxal phosphate-dependent [Variovorax sp. NFACC29]SFC86527.1 D-serine deaminase, pyridoxal phosphate-dependent [Variovorax sp. NFACC26]SFF96403.1 D-serine deaminase, pyridoxal phosphate-dependent [Variovorax sp. NFACC27]
MTHTLDTIDTPAALIERTRMQRNIERMQRHMNELGVRFRPHVKTSKCIEVAKAQREAGAQGITVSTLKEAEQFFAEGFTDILYAVGMAPHRLPHALELRRRGCELGILTDSVESARAIAAFGRANGEAFDVLIEVDTDGHRSGIRPEEDSLLEVARVLHEGGMRLGGVMTHAGSSYELDTPEALRAMAEQERSGCVHAAQRLREAGLPCPVVSVGSTPTALMAGALEGVTEVRAGVYVFFDLVMRNIGVCTEDDIALSVLTTVIGHQAEKGWAIVDAGWMAMSRDRGTQKQKRDFGYGQVCDLDGRVLGGYVLGGANQEHSILSREGEPDAGIVARFPIGTRLRILPNHACATGAQFPEYQALSEEGELKTWSRFHGW